MKPGHVLAAVLCALPTGCDCDFALGRPHTFFRYSFRNVLLAPVDGVHEWCRVQRNEALAWDAWKVVRREEGKHTYSRDYAQGFRNGFTDYLTFGGNGDAPPLPPYCYRTPQYETPEGRQAVEDWYTGFRRGVATAQASGLRETITLPIGRAPQPATDPGAVPQPAGRQEDVTPQLPSPTPELPMPRVVSP
jgi:hypothetical protein